MSGFDPNAYPGDDRDMIPDAVTEEIESVIANQLAVNYRFLLAYPNSADTVDMDAAGMVQTLREAGYEIVKAVPR